MTITRSIDLPERRLNEECGVFAIAGDALAAERTRFALVALQHRGPESAGIATVDGLGGMYHHRGMGLVSEALPESVMPPLARGASAVGHVRYSTSGSSCIGNAQPLVFAFSRGNLALAHNGNLVNAAELRHELERTGAIFQTTSDTEVVAHLVARSQRTDLTDAIADALDRVEGGFAMCLLADDRLVACRDRHGLRPLVLGRLGSGAWCVASESCALDTVGATFVRDVEPGELLVLDPDGTLVESRFAEPAERALCSFEHIYFARPDSDVDGHNVHAVRKRFGTLLAGIAPVDADLVMGVPDSSISAAIGYAEQSRIPYEIGLIKNRYIGRTFLEPSQELRTQGVRMKLSAVRGVVRGKRVVMVDDSLVRGTTAQRIVTLLRDAGAAEVHVRIACPPVTHPCFYGIDTSTREELVSASSSVEQIRELVGADSLAFLDEPTMMRAFAPPEATEPACGHCNACFTGRYPVSVEHASGKLDLERRLAGVR
jgi:amidophosphoribosyltransferase